MTASGPNPARAGPGEGAWTSEERGVVTEAVRRRARAVQHAIWNLDMRMAEMGHGGGGNSAPPEHEDWGMQVWSPSCGAS
jgi:hypothetical protein